MSNMKSRKRIRWNNNKEDWDCGIQALHNLQKITGTRKKVNPKRLRITKKEGVSNFLIYRKALEEDPKVQELKVKAEPKPKEIKEWLEEDKSTGKHKMLQLFTRKKKTIDMAIYLWHKSQKARRLQLQI